jgi:hypothetical protein
MGMKDANYWWFADVFMRQLLFYGTSTAPIAPVVPPDTTHIMPVGINSAKATPSRAQPQGAFSVDSDRAVSGAKAVEQSKGSGFNAANTANGVEYAAQFPAFGAAPPTPPTTATSRGVPLDLVKQSKLEARLGFGGEVKAPAVRPTPTIGPAGAAKAAYNSSNGSGFQRRGAADRKSGPPSASPGQRNNAADAHAEPAKLFPGAQQFFFRFIVSMNNARFNQCLLSCMLAEIALLMRADEDAVRGRAPGGHFLSVRGGASSVTASASDDREYILSPENYALKVTKLKILGRFLGTLLFCNRWASSSVVNGAQEVPASTVEPLRAGLQLNIPVRASLEEAVRQWRLCLCVPWVVEFLKMLAWDPLLLAPNIIKQPVDEGATGPTRSIPYMDTMVFLRSIQFSAGCFPIGSSMTSNR